MTPHRIDGSFVATILETAAVGVLYLAWRSITEGTSPDGIRFCMEESYTFSLLLQNPGTTRSTTHGDLYPFDGLHIPDRSSSALFCAYTTLDLFSMHAHSAFRRGANGPSTSEAIIHASASDLWPLIRSLFPNIAIRGPLSSRYLVKST